MIFNRFLRIGLTAVLMTVSAASWAASPTELDALSTDESSQTQEGWTSLRELVADLRPEDARAAPYVRPRPESRSICASCEFHLGVGGTYHSFEGTGGVVIPATVSWNRSRWEFGVFRFSTQSSDDNDEHVERLVARPYWGASLSRRFQLYRHGPLRAIFGFGISYRTEQDILSATHWNFSSQLGLRFQPERFPAVFELSARHWSNGGVRTPNRGQDFTILTVRFDR
jgi:hypothetical protein